MKISIITINLNNLDGLIRTVESVISQTYENIEYIIIDGGSDDGSVEYIKKMQKHFSYWKSKPDKGIYNAMNYGLNKAFGTYVLFLNSGDYLCNNKIIEKFTSLKPTEDIVYGNVKRIPQNDIYDGEFYLKKLFYKNINHQSIFYKKNVFDKYGRYVERYKIKADHALNIKIFSSGCKTRYIDIIISCIDTNGVSSIYFDYDFWKNYKENLLIPFNGIINKKEIYSNLWRLYYHLVIDKKNIKDAIIMLVKIAYHEHDLKKTIKAIRPLLSTAIKRLNK